MARNSAASGFAEPTFDGPPATPALMQSRGLTKALSGKLRLLRLEKVAAKLRVTAVQSPFPQQRNKVAHPDVVVGPPPSRNQAALRHRLGGSIICVQRPCGCTSPIMPQACARVHCLSRQPDEQHRLQLTTRGGHQSV